MIFSFWKPGKWLGSLIKKPYGVTFYTYTFNDPEKCARRYYETLGEARQDIKAFRAALISEEGMQDLLPDLKIVQLRTRPITLRALIELFNNIDGDLGGFICSRKVVEIVTEPQISF